MNILQLTAHFRPNIGGVETHLDDLVKSLVKNGFGVVVLTYMPLQTKTHWKMIEKEDNLQIVRIPWIPSLFYKFIKVPLLEFLYLLPGLFVLTPIIMLSKKIDVIHAHGLVAGFVGMFWGKIFNKRVVMSLHSIYHFPKTGLYKNFVRWIFRNADYSMGLSKQSVKEIRTLGVSADKVGQFTYWIDLDTFRVYGSRLKAKQELGWRKEFVVLFVGRLVPEKGIGELLESAKTWDKNILLKICGIGPLENTVKLAGKSSKNIEYLGSIDQSRLPMYYSGSDILIVPSVSEEGFGRVILEALACKTPILGSNRGAIPEAMDESVGELIDISPNNIKVAVESIYKNKEKLKEITNNCRLYAERRFSEKNVQSIIRSYQI